MLDEAEQNDNKDELDKVEPLIVKNHEQYTYLNEFISHNINSDKNAKVGKEHKELFTKVSGDLDKYYTKKSVAQFCYESMKSLLSAHNKNLDSLVFVEPSAGSGVFLDIIEEAQVGFDIAPTIDDGHNIIKNDFLVDNMLDKMPASVRDKSIVFIGNPPFGKKASLAIEFVNQSLSYSNIVGFIVPLQFRKWSVQSKINSQAKLILDLDLQENAFEFMGKDYKVRCCFQVWVLDSFSNDLQDARFMVKPQVNHADFEMYQFNRTEQALKFFDYDWDFAVPRQGYLDYTFKAYKKEDCDKKQQWIFFKAKDKAVLDNLLSLDFTKLSKKNIGTPGFGKADVVQEYISIFEKN